MKEQINNMNSEILHFQRTNNNLKLIVADLHLRQKGMKQEIENQNKVVSDNNNYIKSFENDISECAQTVNDYKKLKKHVLRNYDKYVQTDTKKFESNVDVQKELINQRIYLESCVKTLKEKFENNMKVHKQDNLRIMKENFDLIREINDLKREKKTLLDNKKKMPSKKKDMEAIFDPVDRELEHSEEDIRRLLEEADQLQKLNNALRGKSSGGVKFPALDKK